ncbi:hypothetical protein OV090_37890 [Nannocystis sp. RBIL2]|uniref:hypothetical protein n=1 Tax=Nannocystis sp. RBIL2 TaxID=2996788 RepID=UPI002271B852|nr:hypothetical protein [Nannocystis sp. RBIL2]MCY1070575.1 hypothetical protein [Nannocystis sp. RBIL2]
MRLLIAYPLSLMFLALSPACLDKHSLGEWTDTAGESSDSSSEPSDSTGEPPDSTGEPSDSTGKPPDSTGEPSDTTSGDTTDEPSTTTEGVDDCSQYADEASCVAAGCQFAGGQAIEVDADGCHWSEGEFGFCASEIGGSEAPALHCDPNGVPVVFPFDPFNLPADWGACDCEVQGLALGCYDFAINVGQAACGSLAAHCDALTDEASCDQFQGSPGLNGCLWVETTHEVAAEPVCNAEPPVGRCIPVYLRTDLGCLDLNPPDSCDPVDAVKTPYWGRVSDDVPPSVELELLDDVPCEFEPLGYQQCWAEDSPALCDCACGP